MSIQQHLTYLGATYIGLAALNVLIALALFAVMAGEGLPSGGARELVEAITSDVRGVVALLSLFAAAPCLIGGVGLLFAGIMSVAVAVVSWAFERRVAGQKAGAAGEL